MLTLSLLSSPAFLASINTSINTNVNLNLTCCRRPCCSCSHSRCSAAVPALHLDGRRCAIWGGPSALPAAPAPLPPSARHHRCQQCCCRYCHQFRCHSSCAAAVPILSLKARRAVRCGVRCGVRVTGSVTASVVPGLQSGWCVRLPALRPTPAAAAGIRCCC